MATKNAKRACRESTARDGNGRLLQVGPHGDVAQAGCTGLLYCTVAAGTSYSTARQPEREPLDLARRRFRQPALAPARVALGPPRAAEFLICWHRGQGAEGVCLIAPTSILRGRDGTSQSGRHSLAPARSARVTSRPPRGTQVADLLAPGPWAPTTPHGANKHPAGRRRTTGPSGCHSLLPTPRASCPRPARCRHVPDFRAARLCARRQRVALPMRTQP